MLAATRRFAECGTEMLTVADSARKDRRASPVHLIRLTETRGIASYIGTTGRFVGFPSILNNGRQAGPDPASPIALGVGASPMREPLDGRSTARIVAFSIAGIYFVCMALAAISMS